jgi:predicted MFS family arabinose efflux permease
MAVLALPFIGTSTAGAIIGLFFFYLTFEYAIVSRIPLMTEVLPSARATIMAVNVAAISLGRAIGALISTQLYIFGTTIPNIPDILPGALAAVFLNLIAMGALRLLQLGIQRREAARMI